MVRKQYGCSQLTGRTPVSVGSKRKGQGVLALLLLCCTTKA